MASLAASLAASSAVSSRASGDASGSLAVGDVKTRELKLLVGVGFFRLALTDCKGAHVDA